MHPASVKEFSVAISEVVRQYIEAAFQVTATHRTTEEFLHDLLSSSNAALAAHRGLLADFLQHCDMAKFAGVGLSMQIMESLHRSARSFVIETAKPVPAGAAGGRMIRFLQPEWLWLLTLLPIVMLSARPARPGRRRRILGRRSRPRGGAQQPRPCRALAVAAAASSPPRS